MHVCVFTGVQVPMHVHEYMCACFFFCVYKYVLADEYLNVLAFVHV